MFDEYCKLICIEEKQLFLNKKKYLTAQSLINVKNMQKIQLESKISLAKSTDLKINFNN